ncbi:hypothetical protein GCM10027605_33010 [Micromonospora zhanjiangensis]
MPGGGAEAEAGPDRAASGRRPVQPGGRLGEQPAGERVGAEQAYPTGTGTDQNRASGPDDTTGRRSRTVAPEPTRTSTSVDLIRKVFQAADSPPHPTSAPDDEETR